MTPEDLQAIRARLEARVQPDVMEPIGGDNPYYRCTVCGMINVQIVGAHSCEQDQDGEDLDALLAEVEELTESNDSLAALCNRQKRAFDDYQEKTLATQRRLADEIAALKQSSARGGRVFDEFTQQGAAEFERKRRERGELNSLGRKTPEAVFDE